MPKTLTLANVRAQLAPLGIVIRRTHHGELRVNFKGGQEATAYYATEYDDALGTGRAMAAANATRRDDYTFQKYDVLQSANGRDGAWQDFCTLKTDDEAVLAIERVDRGTWDGKPLTFRIVRHEPLGRGLGMGYVTKYERSNNA